MASRYWVGGSGSWQDLAHWSETSGGTGGATVPTSSDDVIFDANSGTPYSTINLTLAAPLAFNSFNATDWGSINLTYSSNIIVNCYGDFIGSNSMTNAGSTTRTMTLYLRGTSSIFSPRGASFITRFSNNIPGSYTLASALTAYEISISGSLYTDGYTITADFSFYSNNAVYVDLSTSDLYGPYWAFPTALKFNAGSSTIHWIDSSYRQVSVLSGNGSITLNNVDLEVSTYKLLNSAYLNAIVYINTFNIVNNNNLTGIVRFNASANITIDNISCVNTQPYGRIALVGYKVTNSTVITHTTASLNNVDFLNISFTNPVSGTNLGDVGNNSNITFDAPRDIYIVNPSALTTISFYDNIFSDSQGGNPVIGLYPLPQDNIYINENLSTRDSTTIYVVPNAFLGNIVDNSIRPVTLTHTSDAPAGGINFAGNITGSGKTILSAYSTSSVYNVYIIAAKNTTKTIQGLSSIATYNVSGYLYFTGGGTIQLNCDLKNDLYFSIDHINLDFTDRVISTGNVVLYNGGVESTLAFGDNGKIVITSSSGWSAIYLYTSAGGYTGSGLVEISPTNTWSSYKYLYGSFYDDRKLSIKVTATSGSGYVVSNMYKDLEATVPTTFTASSSCYISGNLRCNAFSISSSYILALNGINNTQYVSINSPSIYRLITSGKNNTIVLENNLSCSYHHMKYNTITYSDSQTTLDLNGKTLTTTYADYRVNNPLYHNISTINLNGGVLRFYSSLAVDQYIAITSSGVLEGFGSTPSIYNASITPFIMDCEVRSTPSGRGFSIYGASATDTFQIRKLTLEGYPLDIKTVRLPYSLTLSEGIETIPASGQQIAITSYDGRSTLSYIYQTSGVVSVSNCTISNTYVTGGALWKAFTSNNNIDAGNNTGWAWRNGIVSNVSIIST